MSRIFIDAREDEKRCVFWLATVPIESHTFLPPFVQAAALSLVFHAASPMVPTFRADVRVFEVGGERWFGGGADLTPYYLYDEDAQAFHRFWHAVCERHACADHAEYKKWCDDYFYIPSRKEHRGVGGIFFDDLSSQGAQEFTQEVAEQWLASYLSIVEKRRQLAFTEVPLP